MTYEEYKTVEWQKHKPFINTFPDDEETEVEKRYFQMDKECLCKMDWLNYCFNRDETELFSKKYLFSFFDELIQLLELSLSEMNANTVLLDLGFFNSFMQLGKQTYLTKADREKLDDLLVDVIHKYVNNDMYDLSDSKLPSRNFKIRFAALLRWAEFRPEYLRNNEMGFSPAEYTIVSVFFHRNRDSFMKLRMTDYEEMAHFGNYTLWIYENCKTIDRRMMAGDIVKVHDLTLDVVRNVLVSCRVNAFDEKEQVILKIIEELNAETTLSPTVFISYNWNDTGIADKIQNAIGSYAVIRRDTKDLNNGDSISRFMRTIRKQDFAILIISDVYLKSRNCMYEVLQLLKDYEDESFFNKVVLAVLSSAKNIYSSIGRATYISYWQNEYDKLKSQIENLPPESTVSLANELKTVHYIATEIGDFLDKVKDLKNPPEDELLEYVKKRVSGTGIIGSSVVEDVLMALSETAEGQDAKRSGN